MSSFIFQIKQPKKSKKNQKNQKKTKNEFASSIINRYHVSCTN